MNNKNHLNNTNGGRKARALGRFNYEKLMQLAQNSFKVNKFARAADNCRLAVELAVGQNNPEAAAEAYQLWIKAYLELKKYAEVKKICCEARSKYGNYPDLVYYEFKIATLTGENLKASRLGREFIEMCNGNRPHGNAIFTETCEMLPEVATFVELHEVKQIDNSSGVELERING